MRYISITLTVEGSTDKAFLWPVVYRTALSLASNAVIQEAAYFIERGTNEERAVRICEHAKEFDVFVVHADTTRASQTRIRRTIVDSIREDVVSRCAIERIRLIGLLTVSEMESWALASPNAIAEALGFNGWPERLTLHWNPAEVEVLADPKATLRDAFQALLGRPLDHVSLQETLETLANIVPLEVLASIPSYREFRDELHACLTELRASN